MGDPRDGFTLTEDGETRGETIGFEGKNLILKKEDDFFKFPISYVEPVDDHLVLKKKVNWKKAGKQGEKWRKKELDPL